MVIPNSEGMKAKGVVIDLDGTLLLGNSFERYYFFLLRRAFQEGRLLCLLRLLALLLGRKLRFYSHSCFKQRVLMQKGLDEQQLQIFVETLVKEVNPEV